MQSRGSRRCTLVPLTTVCRHLRSTGGRRPPSTKQRHQRHHWHLRPWRCRHRPRPARALSARPFQLPPSPPARTDGPAHTRRAHPHRRHQCRSGLRFRCSRRRPLQWSAPSNVCPASLPTLCTPAHTSRVSASHATSRSCGPCALHSLSHSIPPVYSYSVPFSAQQYSLSRPSLPLTLALSRSVPDMVPLARALSCVGRACVCDLLLRTVTDRPAPSTSIVRTTGRCATRVIPTPYLLAEPRMDVPHTIGRLPSPLDAVRRSASAHWTISAAL